MPFTPRARTDHAPSARGEGDAQRVVEAEDGDDEVLRLEDPWEPPARPPVPLVASTVPILGAVALWLVTGSVLALWLAALGPLIAVATIADAARTARRDRRRAAAGAARTRDDVARTVRARHRRERERWWTTHPDVARLVVADDAIWRPHGDRGDTLVIGRGRIPSAVRVTGGQGDPAARDLRRRAGVLDDAPIAVPSTIGIAVIGPPALAAAVARALALQACLLHAPGRLTITSVDAAEQSWIARLPHGRAGGSRSLTLAGPGTDADAHADVRVIRLALGTPVPPSFGVVLSVDAPDRARADIAGETYEVRPEAIGLSQAEVIADVLRERARTFGRSGDDDRPVLLGDLLRTSASGTSGGLAAVIGRGDDAVSVDLVDDGPHAVVAGMTGSGKSEMLVTWVLALCARYSTREVTFLLADFKGGTAFARLAGLPHVTGVITDLDPSGARRAMESLRAEIRWREGELARVGARDVGDERAGLPRLVVVVDEFAALLVDHPELHVLFTDIAARGRALGLHLILGTQRLTGVVRESLLANAPLRVCLRVADAADSRAVIGTDDAARPPATADRAERGVAWVRRSGDVAPRRFRVALSSAQDLAEIADRAAGPTPRRSWLPALPARVDLAGLLPLARAARDARPDELVLGLLDEPTAQRQTPAVLRDRGLLILGTGGCGRTTALRTLAAQRVGRTLWVPREPESAWDALKRLGALRPGSLAVIDDLDALIAGLPADYGGQALDELETVIRGAAAGGITVAVSAQRLSGGVARLAELLPRRVLLATRSRADHVALGGDPGLWLPDAGPGRGSLGGLALQVAVAEDVLSVDPFAELPDGGPGLTQFTPRRLTGFVSRPSPRSRAALRAWERGGAAVVDLAAFESGLDRGSRSGRIVVVGDPDEWQRQWRALALIRADHDLLVDAACGPEYRVLTADRTLPPYCLPGRGRAWLREAGDDPKRVVLPDTTVDA